MASNGLFGFTYSFLYIGNNYHDYIIEEFNFMRNVDI